MLLKAPSPPTVEKGSLFKRGTALEMSRNRRQCRSRQLAPNAVGRVTVCALPSFWAHGGMWFTDHWLCPMLVMDVRQKHRPREIAGGVVRPFALFSCR